MISLYLSVDKQLLCPHPGAHGSDELYIELFNVARIRVQG